MKIAKLSVWPAYFKWEFVDDSTDITKYIQENEWVHDSDSCGDNEEYWVMMADGDVLFFKSEHEWNWHNYGKEDSHLDNDFMIMEVGKDEIPEEHRKNLKFVV